MSQVYVSMAMSLDGFITGPHDDAPNPAGINGMRLMDWLGGGGGDGDASGVEAFRPRDTNSQIVFDEALATGAVITESGPGTSPATGTATITTACRSSFRPTGYRPRTRSSGSTT